MATSGTIKTTCGTTDQYDYWAYWKRNSYSIENNKSNITIYLRLQRNDGYSSGAYNLATKPTVTLKVGGATKTPTVSYIDTRNGAECTFATWTGDVSHDDDGSLDLKISASFTMTGATSLSSASLSGTASITSIPRTSEPTLSADSVTMLETVKITTNRKSTSFTHDLTYKFNGYTGTIATGVGWSYTWTVPDLVSKISGKSSATCTIYCKTKSGSTVVGTESVTLTLSIPAKSTPSASASTVKMGTSVDIYTNRKSSAYTHTLTYEVGDTKGTIDEKVGGGRTWTPSKNLAAHTGDMTSAVCTITCSTYNGTLLVGTDTTKITLTVSDATIPILSKSSIVLGESITILTPREVDCYEHNISYTLKAKGSSTVALSKALSTTIQESYEWTPSLALLAPAIPSATEGTITLTCTTKFQGSEKEVGTATASFDITVPNNETTRPKFTINPIPVHTLSSEFDGVYVQGKSKVRVSYEASSDYSTIKSYETKILGVTSNTNPYTSSVLSNDGTVTIVSRVTDARGYFTEKTTEIEVAPYSRPRVIPGENQNKIICTRSNSDETVDAGGVWLLIKAGRRYSKVMLKDSQKNFCSLSYQWKTDAQGDDDFSDPIELLARDGETDYISVNLPNIVSSNLTAYNIKLIAEDDVGESDVVIVTVPTAFATFHAPKGGHGFTLGGYHDPSKIDVFDCRFDAEFQGNVSGRVLGLGTLPAIPEGADANEYKEYGAFAVRKTEIAKTLVNFPSTKAGTLRVWASNGGSIATDWAYIIQEYIPFDNYCTYRRYLHLEGESWVYEPWKVTGGLDAIVEQGTTNNWYWRKYANGTAECWRRCSQTVNINIEWGGFFYANCEDITFPFTFAEIPIVNTSAESSYSLMLVSRGNASTTAPASVRVFRIGTVQEAAPIAITYHAIGRWK